MKRWYGKLLGLVAGALLFRVNPLFGAIVGLLIGHAFDSDWFRLQRGNPYLIFDLDEYASDETIEKAYRRMISQYHPDKQINAAPEIRALAEKKSKEINAAYSRIKKLRQHKR